MTGVDLRIGCCGFPMAREDYFTQFNLVEIQQTLYQPPRLATIQRWREEAPASFEFSLKAWQLITHGANSPTYRRLKTHLPKDKRDHYGHFRPTDEVFSAWRTTLETARALKARVLVFQTPSSFTPTGEHITDMHTFFRTIRSEAEGLTFAWEQRGQWPKQMAAELCQELNLLQVIDPFHDQPTEGKLHYFRLHGIGEHGERYSDEHLRELLALCREPAYCLFNNANMAEDAARFAALAKE